MCCILPKFIHKQMYIILCIKLYKINLIFIYYLIFFFYRYFIYKILGDSCKYFNKVKYQQQQKNLIFLWTFLETLSHILIILESYWITTFATFSITIFSYEIIYFRLIILLSPKVHYFMFLSKFYIKYVFTAKNLVPKLFIMCNLRDSYLFKIFLSDWQ